MEPEIHYQRNWNELTEQGIDSLTPTIGQGEKLVLKVEVYPPFERDAVDIGLVRLSVTSDSSSDEVFTTPVAWTVHRTFGIVGEVISDSDGGTLGQIGPVSPGSTVLYNVRITDSSDDAGQRTGSSRTLQHCNETSTTTLHMQHGCTKSQTSKATLHLSPH